jgi:hypothetical protein
MLLLSGRVLFGGPVLATFADLCGWFRKRWDETLTLIDHCLKPGY